MTDLGAFLETIETMLKNTVDPKEKRRLMKMRAETMELILERARRELR